MNTPTPRTDEQINGKPCTRFEVLGGDSLRDAYVPSQFARTLERELTAAREELTAVTEQRDRLLEEREQWRLSSVCRELTEQRDRLAEALQSVKCELGVPQPEYPSPVANAYWIADEALQSLNPTEP
ncbi:hypothetical protein UFOVP612_3 [uncultured Caudovirales phage]|uniref:Uncharacterized protein n=1 Tax=uncultured Caudovirales phage TaxID=2100421 RepID=A0A6J5N0S1_9CAUD|nr:hypothetical protein UFOVP612_3 [uncultured Caudovirales phage]